MRFLEDVRGVFVPKLLSMRAQYSRSQLLRDGMAGLIVGIVALPLAIAFAIASGVSPEVGILTAIVGGFIVSALGGCSVQIGGPTGAFIVIVYGIIERHGMGGLIVASIMAGVLLVIMGVLRLGSLIKFIPYPIVVGFTAGIALTIFSTQMNDLFGLGLTSVPSGFIDKWGTYFSAAESISLAPLLFGLASLAIIIVAPRITRHIPGSLAAIVLLTAIAYLGKRYFNLEGVECIGDRYTIAAALPGMTFPTISMQAIRDLFPSAFTIALLGAIESLLSASVADGVTGDRHSSNTELIGQGVANLVVPLFGGIPVTGAIARTMTNINNGGRTPIAGVVHSIVLLLLLLFLGPLLDFIPMSVLAGVLVIVSYNMSGWRSIASILKGPKGDIAIMVTTFLLTVIFDLTVAIEVGILLAMFIFMRRMVESTRIVVSSGVLPNDPEAPSPGTLESEGIELPNGVEVYEIEGPYFFGIANRFEETMSSLHNRPRARILRMRHVPFMDSTAVHNLEMVVERTSKSGIPLILSGVNPSVRATLDATGLLARLGADNVQGNIHAAIARTRVVLEENDIPSPEQA